MRKTTKPYTLIIGGQLNGFFKNFEGAMMQAKIYNENRFKSSGLTAAPFKIVYEQTGESTRTLHEEV